METLSLKDTAEYMNSSDYKKRFLAEYLQVDIRLTKLKAMLDNYNLGKLDFVPTCPLEIYKFQVKAMEDYRDILKIRASIEGVELPL